VLVRVVGYSVRWPFGSDAEFPENGLSVTSHPILSESNLQRRFPGDPVVREVGRRLREAVLQQGSDLFRHYERRSVASIAVVQQPLRLFIADNLLRVWIEVYCSA
jgi:hypothetical protein